LQTNFSFFLWHVAQEEFFSEMEKRMYPGWRIRQLSMMLTSLSYQSGPDIERYLVQLFAQCVPAVRWFS